MSINELIQSYPFSSFYTDKLVIVGVCLVLLIGIFIFLKFDNRGSGIFGAFFIVVILFGISVFYPLYEEYAQLKWKEDVFNKQYLPSIEEVKVDIISYSINSDGSLNILLDTTEKEKSIGRAKNISYYHSSDPKDRGYIKAKYLPDIDQVRIKEGFYGVNVFLPRVPETTYR